MFQTSISSIFIQLPVFMGLGEAPGVPGAPGDAPDFL